MTPLEFWLQLIGALAGLGGLTLSAVGVCQALREFGSGKPGLSGQVYRALRRFLGVPVQVTVGANVGVVWHLAPAGQVEVGPPPATADAVDRFAWLEAEALKARRERQDLRQLGVELAAATRAVQTNVDDESTARQASDLSIRTDGLDDVMTGLILAALGSLLQFGAVLAGWFWPV